MDEYTPKQGFYDQGNDLIPPKILKSPQNCTAICDQHRACAKFTYSQLENTKVLCFFKTETATFTPSRTWSDADGNCLAPGDVKQVTCSPLPGSQGLGGYAGHFVGHWLSATALAHNYSGLDDSRARKVVSILTKVAETWRRYYGDDRGGGYLFPKDPFVFDLLLSGRPGGSRPVYSVPWYTWHKLMRGLLDQFTLGGNLDALHLAKAMGLWTHRRVEETIRAGGQELWQKVLLTEWGGMNDVLYSLYGVTGDYKFMHTARLFNAFVFTSDLAKGIDNLAVQPYPHANFHLPEIVGHAIAWELTANHTDKKIVDTFFQALIVNHSYATGGSSSGECWQEPRDLGNFLSDQTQESCTQYNVLKVARRRILREAQASDADFYERALWNGILGNQKRNEFDNATSFIYMLPLGNPGRGVTRKHWGRSDFGFPCCWGTLSESFAKLADSIFFLDSVDSGIIINQYVNATVNWVHAGLVLKQEAFFPYHPERTAQITILQATPVNSLGTPVSSAGTIHVRVPGWLKPGQGSMWLNGERLSVDLHSSSYVHIERQWGHKDVLELRFPLSLRSEKINDRHLERNSTFAFMYGPLVLAGIDPNSDEFLPRGGSAEKVDNFIRRTSDSYSLQFEATSEDNSSIVFRPLADVVDESYVVYFVTKGQKPPQPAVRYCPHSDSEGYLHLVSEGGPPSLPRRNA